MHMCKDQDVTCLYQWKSMNKLDFQLLLIDIQIVIANDRYGIKMCPPIMTCSYKNLGLANLNAWLGVPPHHKHMPYYSRLQKYVSYIIHTIEFSFILTNEV